MGTRAFEFYYKAFSAYIQSSGMVDAGDSISWFVAIINLHLMQGEFSKEFKTLIMKDCDCFISIYDELNIDTQIHKNLLFDLQDLNKKLLSKK